MTNAGHSSKKKEKNSEELEVELEEALGGSSVMRRNCTGFILWQMAGWFGQSVVDFCLAICYMLPHLANREGYPHVWEGKETRRRRRRRRGGVVEMRSERRRHASSLISGFKSEANSFSSVILLHPPFHSNPCSTAVCAYASDTLIICLFISWHKVLGGHWICQPKRLGFTLQGR